MKNGLLRAILATSAIFATVAAYSAYADPDQVPPPPQDALQSNNDSGLVLPQITNKKQPNISESAAARRAESDPTKFKIITEQRAPGGAVTQVNVDNPDGGLPDYYLTPRNGVTTSTPQGTNPNQMSTPQWGVVNW